MNPKLKFIIDEKTDLNNAKWFVKNGQFVDRFLPSELLFVTKKRFSTREKNKFIAEYTKSYYLASKKEINAGVIKIRKDWIVIQKDYFNLISKIFPNHPWPKGKYIGYASIFGMFPRDITDKIFFFPFSTNKRNPLRTIGHEMLHFVFFDYLKTKYNLKENSKIKGEKPDYIWRISETFNNVIENWKPYRDIVRSKSKSIPYYPGHEKMFRAMTKQWQKNQNVDNFLGCWLKKK